MTCGLEHRFLHHGIGKCGVGMDDHQSWEPHES